MVDITAVGAQHKIHDEDELYGNLAQVAESEDFDQIWVEGVDRATAIEVDERLNEWINREFFGGMKVDQLVDEDEDPFSTFPETVFFEEAGYEPRYLDTTESILKEGKHEARRQVEDATRFQNNYGDIMRGFLDGTADREDLNSIVMFRLPEKSFLYDVAKGQIRPEEYLPDAIESLFREELGELSETQSQRIRENTLRASPDADELLESVLGYIIDSPAQQEREDQYWLPRLRQAFEEDPEKVLITSGMAHLSEYGESLYTKLQHQGHDVTRLTADDLTEY